MNSKRLGKTQIKILKTLAQHNQPIHWGMIGFMEHLSLSKLRLLINGLETRGAIVINNDGVVTLTVAAVEWLAQESN